MKTEYMVLSIVLSDGITVTMGLYRSPAPYSCAMWRAIEKNLSRRATLYESENAIVARLYPELERLDFTEIEVEYGN